jgi:hypothetical protein
MEKDIKQLLYKALRNQFEAEKFAAEATLTVYFNNSVGVGEHPQVVDEMAKQIEKLASANDKLETLQNTFKEYIL